MIYNPTIVDRALGCMVLDTNLANSDKMKLDKSDFDSCQLHLIVYSVLHNLNLNGCKSPTNMDIEKFLVPYPTQYNVFMDNGGLEYINTIKQLGNIENFEYYYNNIRKLSCLRKYKSAGSNIGEFWDIDKSDEENYKRVDEYSIDDIINHFEKKQSDIKKIFVLKNDIEEMILGDGFTNVLDEFKREPMIGGGLTSPILNSLYRGWCKGHLILRGSPSSFGKTTMGISDQVNVSIKRVWSEDKKDFVDNPYYQGFSAYCHTEQKMVTEIQPRFMANISGVAYHKILDGNFTNDEKERLIEAGIIAKESRLKLINYPNFTASGIKETIRNLSLDGYEYFTHDYMWDNFYIGAELKALSGTQIRQDMSLLHLADTLKLSAETYNVAVATMCQLNGREKEVEIVDESCLFGSKSIKTKLDNGSIYMYPRQKELKQVEPLVLVWNKKNNPTNFGGESIIQPNSISHCFKTRYGRYGQNIKVWHYVDNSIGKLTDMFATTWDNKPIDIPKLYIERK